MPGSTASRWATELASLGTLPDVGGGLLFLLAFFGMIASLIQVGIMVVRGAILAVLVGVLPIAAGASITGMGFEWFKRLWGWILSFTVYKLVAAIIYAAAFAMIGNSHDLAGTVGGYSLLILAILALPALLRLIPPSTAAMGSGGGGALLGVGTAAATGAVALAGGGGAVLRAGAASASPGLVSGPGGPPGPSGSDGAAGPKGSSGLPALNGSKPSPGGAGGAGSPTPAGATAAAGGGAAAAAGGPVGLAARAGVQGFRAAKGAANQRGRQ